MILVVIYGPPAVGKLTVARALAKLTRFQVFHNHLTTDLARSIFPEGRHPYAEFCDELRFASFEAAGKHRVPGIIFTFCHRHPEDDRFLDRLEAIVKKHNGRICFVHLSCDRSELSKRVGQSDRAAFGKATTIEELENALQSLSLSPIPNRDGLSVDNTHTSPVEVASRIGNTSNCRALNAQKTANQRM